MGFQKFHGCKKITLAGEGGRNKLAFLLVQNQDFGGKMTSFVAFWNFMDVRFATFSVLTGISFGENTDVRLRPWRSGDSVGWGGSQPAGTDS